MMGFYGYNNMMNQPAGWGLYGLFGIIGWIVVLADLILVGMWLWKQINKK